MRVTPRAWIGFAIWAGYVLVIISVTLLSGVPYPDIGTSAESTWRGAVLDLAVGGALLAILATVLGWWRPALFERTRAHHKWPIFVPIIMFIAAIMNIFNTDWAQFDASFLLSLLALGVLVGFSEELMARGLVLTSFRARFAEGWAWFLSSLLFGLMHLANAVLGAPLLASLAQAGLAFASGTAFYIVRRVTGSLVWAMLLHGLWDVSVFAVGHAPVSAALGSILGPVVGILALAVVYWVIKGADERPVTTTPTANPAVA
ncbi:hypothetical protein ASD65_16175 [Microbacterium sp. Root61]|uniref:CPBP family intramembrane glutamic endopeptidase n=1 Tax=Microbacterium sp. Root61 TaxID=1736570 RepID=UPI0006F2E572|nr:CPBP family intramembrane glutamic endopeptidase [Microbacterium sp. Root61]KRA25789.1 hypothetical protein ASD65_16175 [Microbacterium sp. Root61]